MSLDARLVDEVFNRHAWSALASVGATALSLVVSELLQQGRYAALPSLLDSDLPERPGSGVLLVSIAQQLARVRPHERVAAEAVLGPLIEGWVGRLCAGGNQEEMQQVAQRCLLQHEREPIRLVAALVAGGMDWQACLLGEAGMALTCALQQSTPSQFNALEKLAAVLPPVVAELPQIAVQRTHGGAAARPLHELVEHCQGLCWQLDVQALLLARCPPLRDRWARDFENFDQHRRSPLHWVTRMLAGMPVTDDARAMLQVAAWPCSASSVETLQTFAGYCIAEMLDHELVQVLPILRRLGVPMEGGTAAAPWNTPLRVAVQTRRQATTALLLEWGADPYCARPGHDPATSGTPLGLVTQACRANPAWTGLRDRMQAIVAKQAVQSTLEGAEALSP